jgi:S-adenosylmethionine:tRNA ribosyltransferase-isomerase
MISAVESLDLELREATAPAERRGLQRDAVRLLVTDRRARTQADAYFFDLPSFLDAGDLIVVNDSATLPAALTAVGANGERLVLHVSTMIDERLWTVEPRKHVMAGESLRLPADASAFVLAPVDPVHPRLWYAHFDLPEPMNRFLEAHGRPIRYGYVDETFPLSDYQTLFAREQGSSEMPSAGRPFTPRVVSTLQARGVDIRSITLHCGVASFESPERPATERFVVTAATAGAVNAAKRRRSRVVAVGSTVVRALESARQDGEVSAASGWTDRVIDRDHTPAIPDALLTGFHDSSATHMWMLEALLDVSLLADAYAHAAAQGYEKHEFGDLHLIL